MTRWLTRSTVVATGATSTRTGSVSSSSARPAISFGMVAEKNRVWRCVGSMPAILRIGVDEAQVEHLVGLVEHEDLDLGQGQRACAR